MKCSQIFLAAALAAVAQAVHFTNSAFSDITAGEPFNITWADGDSGITLLLKTGPSNDLTTVTTIASGLDGTHYVWTPSSSIPSGSYALEIDAPGQEPNYSSYFTFVGSVASASSSSASMSMSMSSSGSMTSSASATSSMTSSMASSMASSSAMSSSMSGMTMSMTTSAKSSMSTSASTTTTGSSSTTSSAATTSVTTAAPDGNSGAAGMASPLAFMVMTFAAMLFLN